ISGNGRAGVSVLSPGTAHNQVGGNFIGTNATGTAALANGIGVWLLGEATDNTVGGTGAAAGNVISGNRTPWGESGRSGTPNNVVLGNPIGLTAGGTARLGNGFSGVLIATGASSNTVGGTTAAAGNLIAGNGHHGAEIRDAGTSDNLVQGNT